MQKNDVFYGKTIKIVRNLANLTLLLSSILLLSSCGKSEQKDEKLPEVYTNMMADASFIATVNSNRMGQVRIASKRAVTVEKMTAILNAVKSRLPANATEDQIRAELSKSEEWKALERENAQRNEELMEQIKEARRLVGARMLKQRQDVKAVQDGKAVPKSATVKK